MSYGYSAFNMENSHRNSNLYFNDPFRKFTCTVDVATPYVKISTYFPIRGMPGFSTPSSLPTPQVYIFLIRNFNLFSSINPKEIYR